MKRSARFVSLGLIACMACRGGRAAEESKNESPPARAVSAHTAELLMAAMHRLEAKAAPIAAATPSAAAARVEADRPANEIVRLPSYIVREPRLPQREDVLIDAELAEIGMNRYIGLADGLDRGWLNRFTIKSVWNRIPVLGKFPLLGFETNEERGLRLYREAKKKEEWQSLMGMLSPGEQRTVTSGAPATSPK